MKTALSPLVRPLLATTATWAAPVGRLALASVFFAHGAQKVFGWFGGYGFAGTMNFFTGQLHLPAPLAFLAILAEFGGALGLLLGLGTRLAALGIAVNMGVAVALVHAPQGFFMNWHGQQAGEGIEFHVLALGLASGLIVAGAGRCSVDRWLADHLRAAGPAAHPTLAPALSASFASPTKSTATADREPRLAN